MFSYHFTGRVHPERAWVTVVLTPIETNVPVLSWKGAIEVSIERSQISIIFRGAMQVSDTDTLKNLAESLASNAVNSVGYSWGRGYSVEITAMNDGRGQNRVFGIGVPVLEENTDERPLEPGDVVTLAFGSPPLSRALGDLRDAIRKPDDTGFYAMRAVESVRQHFGKSWPAMRAALNLREETLKALGDYGTPQRHGEIAAMSDSERARSLHLAWKVVDRFCVLLHEGVEELSEREFPLL